MTWFSSMIPGAPGNADSIALVAQTLHESATHAENIEQAVSRIPSSISTWKGHAHLDYLESQQRARSRMIHFNEGMACAANDVESYSWSVRAMHNYVENTLRPTAQELDEAFTRTPAGQRLDAYFSLLAEARTLQGEYRERYNRLKQEAEDLALSLQQALSIEPVAKKSKFAGGFFDPSRTERLSERDIDRINAEIKALREGSFDLRAIAQGSIGDCYYLASLMAVMNSPEGQALLADGIRPHYNQDGTIDGYIVTVYDKPGFFSSGSSTEVLVRDTYANGARSSGSAGVISLYEKAFSQLHPGGVNRSTFFESGITAGYPREALPRVTGQGTSTVDRDGIFGFGSGYDARRTTDDHRGRQQRAAHHRQHGEQRRIHEPNRPRGCDTAQRAGDAHRHLPRTRLRGHTRRFVRPHARQSARYQHGLGDGKRDPHRGIHHLLGEFQQVLRRRHPRCRQITRHHAQGALLT